jgi:hypothetical protein
VQLASGIANSFYNLIGPSLVTTLHPGPNAVPGMAAGGGVELHLGSLIVAPEVRYTHWFDANFSYFGGGNGHLGTHFNQVQALVSLRI